MYSYPDDPRIFDLIDDNEIASAGIVAWKADNERAKIMVANLFEKFRSLPLKGKSTIEYSRNPFDNDGVILSQGVACGAETGKLYEIKISTEISLSTHLDSGSPEAYKCYQIFIGTDISGEDKIVFCLSTATPTTISDMARIGFISTTLLGAEVAIEAFSFARHVYYYQGTREYQRSINSAPTLVSLDLQDFLPPGALCFVDFDMGTLGDWADLRWYGNFGNTIHLEDFPYGLSCQPVHSVYCASYGPSPTVTLYGYPKAALIW